MKLVIFGSRPKYIPKEYNLDKLAALIDQAVTKSGFIPSEIVTGMAAGIDSAAILYARQNGIKIKAMPADWSTGRGAGYARNKQMAMYADGGVGLIWGNSPGSTHMRDVLKSLRKPEFTIYDGNIEYSF